ESRVHEVVMRDVEGGLLLPVTASQACERSMDGCNAPADVVVLKRVGGHTVNEGGPEVEHGQCRGGEARGADKECKAPAAKERGAHSPRTPERQRNEEDECDEGRPVVGNDDPEEGQRADGQMNPPTERKTKFQIQDDQEDSARQVDGGPHVE